MRKAGTVASVVMPILEAENPLEVLARDKKECDIRRLERNIRRLERNIRQLERDIQNYREDIKKAEQEIKENEENEQAVKDDLVEAQNKEIDTEALRRTYSAIMRHSMVEGVRVENGQLIITTRLLFTDIRKEARSRTNKRVCIGAFEIELDGNKPNNIRNLLFTCRPHWVTGTSSRAHEWKPPCLGEWVHVLEPLKTNDDLYGIVDMMYHYLRDTNDAGAYCRSHEWREERKLPIVRLKPDGETLAIGDYVVCLQLGGLQCVGEIGKIVILRDYRHGVEWKKSRADFHSCHGSAVQGHGWYIDGEKITRITKKEYDSGDDLPMDGKKYLPAIDKLPDGSTLADAKKIYECVEN